jgi:hypothetical protein
MRKTKAAQTLALAHSVLLNVALWRRAPTGIPSVPAAAPATPGPAQARPEEIDTDELFLREEVRLLREQLAIARATRALERDPFGLAAAEEIVDPDAREFQELLEHVAAFFDSRETETRNAGGELQRTYQSVLTPGSRKAALGAIEDYLGLEEAERRRFRDWARTAVESFRRVQQENQRDLRAAVKAGEHDEFFEDAALRQQAASETAERRQEQWVREFVQPMGDFLARRNGVRPALLSQNLAGILMQLGSAHEH